MVDSTNNTSVGMMTPWLHFGNTDYLIFKAWRPSHGAIAGACIGLFLFCILERGLTAYRRAQELRWSAKAILLSNSMHPSSGKEDSVEVPGDRVILSRRGLVPPFRPSRDIPRGIIQAIQSMCAYAIMLSVMTFNAAYIIAIILGLGVGEVSFGRIGRHQEV